ncbi:transcriptional antiterminator [Sporosarcina sp. NCCP-2716]|uniref:BglG family transcription antiterminator n=1 Tax=Sporosarcina sp. NCCP-2716 TaxID=2943679 RepID=UPI0020408BBB|nr:BglG family transcription antiterminator [Sporosarcina sp. NCCP-2716]GKV70578.1 transcriptional antiterminator [Sporosarcina sp. NCCP-2716]
MLDKRRVQLLSILTAAASPVTKEELSSRVGISQRSVLYDISLANDWLESRGCDLIQTIYGEGYCLPAAAKEKLRDSGVLKGVNEDYYFSKEERTAILLAELLLSAAPVSMKILTGNLEVSRGTVFSDLQEVKELLTGEEMSLVYRNQKGYVVDGDEVHKRDLLALFLYKIKFKYKLQRQVDRFPSLGRMIFLLQREDAQGTFRKQVAIAESSLGLLLTEENLQLLVIQLIVMSERIRLGDYAVIDKEEISILKETSYHSAAMKMANAVAAFVEDYVPEEEVSFLARQLQEYKVSHYHPAHYSKKELKDLKYVVHRMVTDFQLKACVVFDRRDELERNLLAHIKPTYYRLKYNVPYTDSIVQDIKTNYPDIYNFTRQVVEHLEQHLRREVPDEEAAYIALHFGGWLSKEEKKIGTQYSAIVVCANGIGTSTMIRKQIEDLIDGLHVTKTMPVRGFLSQKIDADIIFTADPAVTHDEIPVIQVPAILSNNDKSRILAEFSGLFSEQSVDRDVELLMETIGDHAKIFDVEGLKEALANLVKTSFVDRKKGERPLLQDLLTAETVQFVERTTDWKEAIRYASEPLLLNGAIQPEYVDAMISNVEELGPYIVLTPGMALPHARPESGVNRVGMSLLHLKEAVAFSELEKHQAHLIIVLAAVDNETHLTALAQLSDLLSDNEKLSAMIASESPEDILKIIS